MPNTKSAKRALRRSLKRRERNKAVKSRIKTLQKKLIALAESGDEDSLKQVWREFQKRVDKAVKTGVFHRNTGNRKKSRIAARIMKILGKPILLG